MSFFGRGKATKPDFVIDAQKELGYHVKSSRLLEDILHAKEQINIVRAELEAKTTWVFRYAKEPVTYRWLIGEMMVGITKTNSLIHKWVLPFIQPDKREKKARAVRGYAQIYIDTMNENYMLLQDLEKKHYIQQKTLVFQRVINNYALYFTIAEFLNGVSPDPEFVRPTKDKTYVLPVNPMMGFGGGIGGPTITGSGGRTSEEQRVRRPFGGPYKREIDNRI